MHDFDKLLCTALMDVNVTQFSAAIESAESTAFEHSVNYRKEQLRLLSHPFKWAKRRAAPVWKRIVRNVACLVLIFSLSLGTLLAVSPAVRAGVLNWLREFSSIGILYQSTVLEENSTPPHWCPAWLPDGFAFSALSASETSVEWTFRSDKSRIGYACYAPGHGAIADSLGEYPGVVCTSAEVNGKRADYYSGDFGSILVWEDKAGNLHWIDSDAAESENTLLKIAEQITIHDADAPDYIATWLPEGYELLSRSEAAGTVQSKWKNERKTVSLLYAQDPLYDFHLPAGESKTVSVHGIDAQLWNSTPKEATISVSGESVSGTSIVVGGVTIITGTDAASEESGTLHWYDAETGTEFLLQGSIDENSLIQIAESLSLNED